MNQWDKNTSIPPHPLDIIKALVTAQAQEKKENIFTWEKNQQNY